MTNIFNINKFNIPDDLKDKCKINYPLAPLTWFKVGGIADIFLKPSSTEELSYFLKKFYDYEQIPITVIGAGSNIIIRDGGIEGVVIKLPRQFSHIELLENNQIKVGASCLNFNLVQFCRDFSLTGCEFLIGIPGTIGGAIAMNAGCYGHELKDILLYAEAFDIRGVKYIFSKEKIGFKRRGNNLQDFYIFTSAILQLKNGKKEEINSKISEINQNRLNTQPIKEKTCGSIFVNPALHKSWELIDKAGMRGYKLGGALISELHSNFMINYNNASAKDLESLGELVRQRVKEQSGIELQWEIKRIGRL